MKLTYNTLNNKEKYLNNMNICNNFFVKKGDVKKLQ